MTITIEEFTAITNEIGFECEDEQLPPDYQEYLDEIIGDIDMTYEELNEIYEVCF
jgi:hypothetical protein